MLRIVHVDATLLVLDKPAGLLSVPGRGPDKQDCLSLQVQQQFPDALVVHRLDMATSGLMLMARGKAAQSTLGRDFADRKVGKRYLAIVLGAIDEAPGRWQTIDLPIALDWPNRPLRIVSELHGKPSQTRWRVREPSQGATTLVELEPVTGRSHQLRVHLKAIGHPIVGDALYGSIDAPGAARMLLHATLLDLIHPETGAALQFRSQPDFI